MIPENGRKNCEYEQLSLKARIKPEKKRKQEQNRKVTDGESKGVWITELGRKI